MKSSKKSAQKKPRVTPSLTPELYTYLEDMSKTGLYGSTVSTVLAVLAQRGVERAIEKEHIKMRTFQS